MIRAVHTMLLRLQFLSQCMRFGESDVATTTLIPTWPKMKKIVVAETRVCIPACTGQGVPAQRGVSAEGVSAWGCLPRGCLPTGCVCPRGVSARVHAGIHPPVGRMTDACENITLP